MQHGRTIRNVPTLRRCEATRFAEALEALDTDQGEGGKAGVSDGRLQGPPRPRDFLTLPARSVPACVCVWHAPCGDDHDGHVAVHQRQRAVLHLARQDALRVDQRHLLNLCMRVAARTRSARACGARVAHAQGCIAHRSGRDVLSYGL
jgi:hypothetical protein